MRRATAFGLLVALLAGAAAAFAQQREEPSVSVDFSVAGYYRMRYDNFFAAKWIDTMGSNWIEYIDQRLQLRPTLTINDRIAIHLQADLLRNVLSGQNLVVEDPLLHVTRFRAGSSTDYVIQNLDLGSTRFATGNIFQEVSSSTGADGEEVPQFQLTRVWGDVFLPFGRLRFGRMPASFGMGLVFNDGLGLDDDYGDTFDRFMFSTAIGPVVPAIGYDRMASGDITSGWSDVHQVFLNANYAGDPISAGGQFAFRTQSSTRSKVYILDGWLKSVYKGFTVEAEGGLFQGATTQVSKRTVEALEEAGYPTGDGGGKVLVNAYLAALRGSYAVPHWTAGVEAGVSSPAARNPKNEFSVAAANLVAEGRTRLKADPDNVDVRKDFLDTILNNQTAFGRRISTFPFDPDYHVDLLLWRRLMGGSVVNGTYAKAFLQLTPFDWMIVRLDVIGSWISSPGSGRDGKTARRDLGWEFDPQIGFSVARHFHLDLRLGYLAIGNYFRDVYSGAKSPYTFQSNFTIDF